MRAYKDSGIEWLGEIPEHWEVVKGSFLFFNKKELNSNFQCKTRLALTLNGVIEKDIEQNFGLNPLDFRTYQIFNYDDLVFKLIDLDNINTSRVGYVYKEGIMSSAYIRLTPNKKSYSKYFYYYYYSLYVKRVFNNIGTGVRSTLNVDELLSIKIPLPPIEEQKAIADFLDSKCKQIESFVDKKQKLITLLNEKKQALINECVTKGLNKNVKYKDSGVEYLGEIPKHWKIKKFKHLAIICNGKEQLQVASDNGVYPIYGSGGIIGKTNQFLYNKQSVLLGRKGTIDKPLFVEIPFWAIDTMFYTKILDIVHSKYFYYLCLTIDFKIYTSGSAIPSMTQSDLAEIIFPFAPLQEQKQIAEFLDSEISKIDSIIGKIKKQIELIKEYKSTLISQAVCGRIGVQ